MQPDQKPADRIGYRESAAIFFTLAYSFLLTARLCLAMFIRRGFGTRAFDPYGLLAMFLMLALAMMDRTLWYVFLMWLGAMVAQRIYTFKLYLRGHRCHSRHQGDPWLALQIPKVKSEDEARKLEPVLCLGLGAAIFPISEPVGLFLGSGFVVFPLCVAMEFYMNRLTDQRMVDAEAEMQHSRDGYRGRV